MPDLAEVRTVLDHMIENGQRASDIIKRIRAMAMRAAPDRQPVDLNELIEDSVHLVHRELTNHDVRLRLRLSADLPLVMGDRVQLQQVFINLMVNAIQAMVHANSELRDLMVKTSTHDSVVVAEVSDTGPGIPEEHRSRLFDAFFSTKTTGMGMGLSICKSIVASHHGMLEALPAPEGGALFRLTIPQPN